MKKTSVAVIGTHGIPSNYGGFETLAEYLAEYLAKDFDLTVFCPARGNKDRFKTYKGCNLNYIHFGASGIQSIPYDIISLFKAVNRYDKILILGVSGGIIMPFLRKYRKKFILNIGGLDWKRYKWGYLTRKYLRLSEHLAIRTTENLISDNLGIHEYLENEYNRDSFIVPYGGDHVFVVKPTVEDYHKYSFLNGRFAFSVARIQADNNIEVILDAFTGKVPFPVIFVGNWSNSSYGRSIRARYSDYKNIILLDPIYNQHELNLLRSNSFIYLHGHSVGGTNPSLVEAMALGLPIIAYNCDFNVNTTYNEAMYFTSSVDILNHLNSLLNEKLKEMGSRMKSMSQQNYTWKIVARKYSEIFNMTN